MSCFSGEEQSKKLDELLENINTLPYGDKIEIDMLSEQFMLFWKQNENLHTTNRVNAINKFLKQITNKTFNI